MILRIDEQLASAKTVGRTRSVSPFVATIKSLGLENGGFAYVSHKEWLDTAGQEQTAASQKNGPRYTLRRHGFDCRPVLLEGNDLAQVAEAEGRELTDSDVVYAIKYIGK